jgi:hypothetical protein
VEGEFSEVRMQHPAWMVRLCIEGLPEGILTVKRRPQHPAIKIGSAWIVGFDRDRIDKELARKAS